MNLAGRLIGLLAALYLAACGALAGFERQFIYHPRKDYVTPEAAGLEGVKEIRLTAADGTNIIGWHAPAPPAAPTVLYFHGNGGHLKDFVPRIRDYQIAGMGFFILSYRGYAGSRGHPSEDGLYADGRAALAWLGENGTPPENIFLFGQSLGSGIAILLATERPVGGVILEAPYTAIVDVAAEALPIFPVRILMRDRYPSAERIGAINAPLFIAHGARDGVIPQAHGKRLLELAQEPKDGWFPDEAGHNDLAFFGLDHRAIAFIRGQADRASAGD